MLQCFRWMRQSPWRNKNSLVASCFPPKRQIYYFIGVVFTLQLGRVQSWANTTNVLSNLESQNRHFWFRSIKVVTWSFLPVVAIAHWPMCNSTACATSKCHPNFFLIISLSQDECYWVSKCIIPCSQGLISTYLKIIFSILRNFFSATSENKHYLPIAHWFLLRSQGIWVLPFIHSSFVAL